MCGDPELGKAEKTTARIPEREIRPGQAGSSSDILMNKIDELAGGTILSDAPTSVIDIRLPSPVRKKATTRSSAGVHEEEPDLKVVIRDDGEEDMQNEATHIGIGTPREPRVIMYMDATTPTSLPGDFPDPDIAMT